MLADKIMNNKELKEKFMLLLELRKLQKNSVHNRTNGGEPGREVLQSRPFASDTSEAANNCRSIAWLMFDNAELFMSLFTQMMAQHIDVNRLNETEYVTSLIKDLDKKVKQ